MGSIRIGDSTFEAYINDLLQVANWISYKTNRKTRNYHTRLSSLLVSIFAERFPSYISGIALISPIMLTQRRQTLSGEQS